MLPLTKVLAFTVISVWCGAGSAVILASLMGDDTTGKRAAIVMTAIGTCMATVMYLLVLVK